MMFLLILNKIIESSRLFIINFSINWQNINNYLRKHLFIYSIFERKNLFCLLNMICIGPSEVRATSGANVGRPLLV